MRTGIFRDLIKIGLLAGAILFGFSRADLRTPDPSLLGVIASAVGLVGVWRLDIGLILAMFAINNPTLNFYMLNSEGFGAGQIRFFLSISCLTGLAVALFLGVAVRRSRRIKSIYDLPFAGLAVVILVGTLVGYMRGNDLRELVAESFPYLEACSFYFIASFAFRERRQIRLWIASLFAWTLICNAADIVAYFDYGGQLTFRIETGSGIILGRLVNFMITLTIPALFAYLLSSPKQLIARLGLYAGIASGVLILVLGSFRSIWIGLIIAATYVMYRLRDTIRIGKALAVVTGISIAIGVSKLVLENSGLFGGLSLADVLKDRFSEHALYEGSSYLGRISAFKSLFIQSLSTPIVGHGLGAYFSQGMASFPVSSSPNLPLNLLYSLGFVGFAVVSICATAVFYKTDSAFRRSRDADIKALSLAIGAAMLSFFGLSNLFPTMLHVPMLAYLSVACAALGAELRLSGVDEIPARRPSDDVSRRDRYSQL